MLRCFTIGFLFLGTVALAGAGPQNASAATIPADEAWTEAASTTEFGWGNYEGTQDSITLDTTDKTTGTGSIKYTGVYHSGPIGSSVIFKAGHHIDLSGYAGGTISYDFKYDGPATYSYSQVYIYSGSTSYLIGSINNIAPDLQPGGWTHISATLPASWKTGTGFDPKDVQSIRLRLIFHKGGVYDATPRNVWFDNLELTSVPEPASGGLFLLGGLLLPMLRRRGR